MFFGKSNSKNVKVMDENKNEPCKFMLDSLQN
jgi:hypothetical protein